MKIKKNPLFESQVCVCGYQQLKPSDMLEAENYFESTLAHAKKTGDWFETVHLGAGLNKLGVSVNKRLITHLPAVKNQFERKTGGAVISARLAADIISLGFPTIDVRNDGFNFAAPKISDLALIKNWGGCIEATIPCEKLLPSYNPGLKVHSESLIKYGSDILEYQHERLAKVTHQIVFLKRKGFIKDDQLKKYKPKFHETLDIAARNGEWGDYINHAVGCVELEMLTRKKDDCCALPPLRDFR